MAPWLVACEPPVFVVDGTDPTNVKCLLRTNGRVRLKGEYGDY